MNGKRERYAVVAGVRRDALDELFDMFTERDPDDPTSRVTTYVMMPNGAGRTATRSLPGARVTVTEQEGINREGSLLNFDKPDSERVVLLTATGVDLERFGPDIASAVGFDDDDVLPFEELSNNFALSPNQFLSSLDDDALRLFLAMARWRTLPFKPPVLLGHASTADEARKGMALLRSAVSPFVREYVLAGVLDSGKREAINGLLGIEADTSATSVTIPVRHAVVLGPDPYSDEALMAPIVTAGKTPIASKDARKLTRALLAAMAAMPDPSQMLLDQMAADPSTAPRPALPPEPGVDVAALQAQVASLESQVERQQEALAAAEARTVGLRRELRAAHYALGQNEEADQIEPPQPAQPQDEDGGADEPPQPSLRSAALSELHPSSFAEVFELARTHLPDVALPEKVEAQVAELLGHPKTSRWVMRTWHILLTLQDFADARANALPVTNLRTYMSELAHPLFAPKQVAMAESNQLATNRKFRTERTFPVPVEVDPSGRVFMEAHVRVDSGGKYPAPRLYLHDDTAGATGKVHVGYIGPHLTNFRTT